MSQKRMLGFLFLLLLAGGWYGKLGGYYEVAAGSGASIRAGDEKFEKTLYQEANGYYQEALNIQVSRKATNKWIASCEAFYKEMNDFNSRRELLAALEYACGQYPNENSYWERRMELCIESEDYDAAYSVCRAAQEAGIRSEKYEELKQDILYSYFENGRYRSDYGISANGYIPVENGDGWSMISSDGEDESEEEYMQLGYVGENGIFLCENGRDQICYMDLNGVKRGVVKKKVSDFGTYSNGFCNVSYREGRALIDLDGEILAEGLKSCGCFQNGFAPVQKKDGTWGLIGTDGTLIQKNVEDIVMDAAGRYAVSGTVIACKDGSYRFFDEEISKPRNKFAAAGMDILTSDGIVAYQDENGKWGYADTDGNILIKPQYEKAKSFSCGLAAVCKKGKWGYINRDNAEVLKTEYLDCGYVSDKGICFVSEEEGIFQMFQFRFPDLIR